MSIRYVIISLFVFSSLLLTVWGYEGPHAAQPAKQGQEGVEGKKTSENLDFSVEEIKETPYRAAGRRDPFVSIITSAKEKMRTTKKSKNPLENFDVTDFKLQGIIYDGKQYWANVILPDQKAYNLRKGMKVGIFGGKIVDIASDRLVVKEFVVDFMGNLQPKYTELKLRKEEEQ